VSCPRSSPFFTADAGDKKATENKEPVFRFRRLVVITNFGIGTLVRAEMQEMPAYMERYGNPGGEASRLVDNA
jgi:hypothetical protein